MTIKVTKNVRILLLLALFMIGTTLLFTVKYRVKVPYNATQNEAGNKSVELNIPENEIGEGPGQCKISLVSKSALYPVQITDLNLFYDFNDTVTNCENGLMTVYLAQTNEPVSVSYISIVFDSFDHGISKTDNVTGAAYSVDYLKKENVLELSLNIVEQNDNTNKSEVVRNILLSEISHLFYENSNNILFEQYTTLNELGLKINADHE